MKTERENIEKENNKQNRIKIKKVKRQVSVITIIMWLFLVITMTTITLNTIKTKNALEVTDENWNIQLVMYDRSSDTPDQAITDFTWNATRSDDTKQLCMQINYACTTNKGYLPGEIEIEIPGIAKEAFSEYWRDDNTYSNWLKNNITIAADKVSDTTKKYDFSYSYNEETNIYTFINNMEITQNEHFEGTIQIVYNLEPRLKIQTDLEYKAKMKENIENAEEIIAKESNVCNFHYTSIKKEYTLIKDATVAPKGDYTKIEDILDDYYWVGYKFNTNRSKHGVIMSFGYDNSEIANRNIAIYGATDCIRENLPEGCVLYDENLNKIEPKEDNI